MHDIDFLPPEYRQNHTQRKWYAWRLIAVTVLAAAMVTLAWNQQTRRNRLEAELARCEPDRAAASQTQESLNELQSRLQLARAGADLVTYFRHPWPRTRIIAAILGPLPDEITLAQLEIARETPGGRNPAEILFRANKKGEEAQAPGRPPAAQDLERLRDEFDSRQTVVTITGVTTESAALHRYLGKLGQDGLFSKAQLHSIETDRADPGRIRFNATLVVRPGYGQPGGPSAPNPPPAAETDPHTA